MKNQFIQTERYWKKTSIRIKLDGWMDGHWWTKYEEKKWNRKSFYWGILIKKEKKKIWRLINRRFYMMEKGKEEKKEKLGVFSSCPIYIPISKFEYISNDWDRKRKKDELKMRNNKKNWFNLINVVGLITRYCFL